MRNIFVHITQETRKYRFQTLTVYRRQDVILYIMDNMEVLFYKL